MNIYYIRTKGRACHVSASNIGVAIKRGVDVLKEEKSTALTIQAELVAKNTNWKEWRERQQGGK